MATTATPNGAEPIGTLSSSGSFTGKVQHIDDNTVKAADRVSDLVGVFECHADLGRRVLQVVKDHGRVELDCGQGVADFMRDAGGHLRADIRVRGSREILVRPLAMVCRAASGSLPTNADDTRQGKSDGPIVLRNDSNKECDSPLPSLSVAAHGRHDLR